MTEQTPVVEPLVLNPPDTKTSRQKLYEIAKENIGKDLSLNQNIPNDVQCAQTVSWLLSKTKINSVPVKGISGTATLYEWMKKSPLFEKTYTPMEGSIIISPTGYGNGKIRGHVGIIGKYDTMYRNDAGIMSNDSITGTLREHWSLKEWGKYYNRIGGIEAHFFNLL